MMSSRGSISSVASRPHLKTRFTTVDTAIFEPEESLVGDERCSQRPAQMVEGKLTRLLKGPFALVSHLRLKGMILPHGR
jgi:hypothetical protein